MEHEYRDGKIIIICKYFEDTTYHVSNERISVIFNGKGAVTGYALANESDMLHGCISLFFKNAPIDIYCEKAVEMIGRCQIITVHLQDATFRIKQFLDASVNGVFASYEVVSANSDDTVTVSFGLNKNMITAVCPGNREIIGNDFRFGSNEEIYHVALNIFR